MFEGKLASVLNGVLGEYVHGISTRDLNVAVFKGDIVLKGMRLKVEALNALGLPFRVLSGVVGKLTLQIPWRALGKQPVVVRIEELYVVAGFAEPDAELTVEERTARWEAAQAALKRRLVDEGETNWLAASDAASDASSIPASASTSGSGDGWLAGMLDTILGNLEVTVSRIHLRLEGDLAAPDSPSGPDPFALGVTLETLALHTVDENGDPTFSSKGLAERMRKSATLERLAAYFDVGAATLRPASSSSWDDVTPAQLTAVMEPGVCDPERVPTVPSDTLPRGADVTRDGTGGAATVSPEARARLRRPTSERANARRSTRTRPRNASISESTLSPRVSLRAIFARRSSPRNAWNATRGARRTRIFDRRRPFSRRRARARARALASGGASPSPRRRFARGARGPSPADRSTGGYDARAATVRGGVRRARRVAREAEKKEGRVGGTVARAVPVGKMPVLDDVERDMPARVCVLFRALAHARARREGAGKSAATTAGAEDDGGEGARAGGMVRGMVCDDRDRRRRTTTTPPATRRTIRISTPTRRCPRRTGRGSSACSTWKDTRPRRRRRPRARTTRFRWRRPFASAPRRSSSTTTKSTKSTTTNADRRRCCARASLDSSRARDRTPGEDRITARRSRRSI